MRCFPAGEIWACRIARVIRCVASLFIISKLYLFHSPKSQSCALSKMERSDILDNSFIYEVFLYMIHNIVKFANIIYNFITLILYQI